MDLNHSLRLHGLDTLRAIAIALVLMSHYAGFVSHAPTFGVVGAIGWAGVDLFFVLSGYLIGNQLLAPVARGEMISLKVFFGRRLLRTLPAYYVVLAVYLLFPHSAISGSGSAPVWRFLSFTQNFGLAYGRTFTHSWSLCIEEQFYLLLPLVVLAMARLRCSARVAWGVLGLAVAAGMAARAYAWLAYGYNASAAQVYYSTFCRSDELLFGVAIAMLKNFHATVFARLLRNANALLATSLIAVVALFYAMRNDVPNSFMTTTFGYSLLAACFALMTCAALSPCSILNRLRVPGAPSLALWSYSVYLAHKPVFMAINVWCKGRAIDTNTAQAVVVIMAIGVLAGWVLYRLVETPFMRLRARWYPAATLSRTIHRHPAPALIRS